MTAAEFIYWWRTQLSELVPAALRGSWQNGKTTVALDIQGDHVHLSTSSSQSRTSFELSDNDEHSSGQEAADFMSNLRGAPQRIRISLAPGEYLLRQLTLPRAAKAHLAEAVGYQLPQLTPFRADQVFYACGETKDSPPDGAISVWLVTMPRKRIERALAAINQVSPQGPLPIKTPPDPEQPLVASWPVTDAGPQPRGQLRLAWFGLIALWIAVLGMHFHNRQQLQEEFDQKRDELRLRAKEVAQLRDRLDGAKSQATWILQRREDAISPLMLIDSLTQQLDDQTWLEGLELRGQRVTLRGVSSSPAALLEALEASSLLQNVRFEAAITRDGRSQGDRFNISAQIEGPTQEGGT
jgi:general secretion pathway protein L